MKIILIILDLICSSSFSVTLTRRTPVLPYYVIRIAIIYTVIGAEKSRALGIGVETMRFLQSYSLIIAAVAI